MVDTDCAYQLIVIEHGNGDGGSRTTQFDKFP